MKVYKILGQEVREIQSTDESFIYYLQTVGQKKDKNGFANSTANKRRK